MDKKSYYKPVVRFCVICGKDLSGTNNKKYYNSINTDSLKLAGYVHVINHYFQKLNILHIIFTAELR